MNGSLDAGLSGWGLEKSDRELVSVSDGEIQIHSADAAQSPRLWQDIDLSRVDQFVHLSAWVKAEQIVVVILLACGTELVQLFVEGRNALPTDIFLDWTGCTVGASIWLLLRKNDRSKS